MLNEKEADGEEVSVTFGAPLSNSSAERTLFFFSFFIHEKFKSLSSPQSYYQSQ